MGPASLDLTTPSPPSGLMRTEKSTKQMSDGNALDPDDGFQISPFRSPVITLQLRGGQRLTIHRDLLLRSVKLSQLCDHTTTSLDLGHISGRAGHVLVQYLYTNRYQALEWLRSPRPDAAVAGFKIAVEVYAVAREYQLDELEDLAKEQIQSQGDGLDAFTVIDAVRVAYPSPTPEDLWFPEYMKFKIKAAFERPATLLSTSVKLDFADTMSIAKMVLRGMLEVYCEMLQSLPAKPAEGPRALKAPPELDRDCETLLQCAPESTDLLAQVPDQPSPPTSASPVSRDVPMTDANAHTAPVELSVDFFGKGATVESEADLGISSSASTKGSDDKVQEIGDQSPIKICGDAPTVKPEAVPGDAGPELEPLSVPQRKAEDALVSTTAPMERQLSPGSDLGTARPSILPDTDVDTRGHVDPPLPITEKVMTTPGRTTPSPSKDGDELWATLLKRRKERRENGWRGTVTFEVTGDESTNDLGSGELEKKDNQLSGTAPEFVPGSQIQQMTDPETPLLGSEASYGVKPLFRHDLVVEPVSSPRSDPGPQDLPDLIPPDPKIWGPIGSHLNKSKSSHALAAQSVAGAKLYRELDLTPEPTSPKEQWESWEQLFSVARARKRAMSMSKSLTALPLEHADADGNSHRKPKTDLCGIVVPLKNPLEPAVVDDSNGGARATPDPEPEPTSGVVLVQDHNNDGWNRATNPPETQTTHNHSVPRKKRSKRSKRLRALAEEQGMALTESVTQAEGEVAGSDVLSQSTADERDQVNIEVSYKDRQGGGLRVQTRSPPRGDLEKHGEGQEQDPWEFWGAKRSPTSRRSF